MRNHADKGSVGGAIWLVTICLSVVAIASPVLAAGNDSTIRIPKSERAKLADLVRREGSDIVVFDDTRFPPLYVFPGPGAGWVEWLSRFHDSTLLVQVVARSSSPTEDGRWLTTDVRAKVLEVIKETVRDFEVGQTLFIVEDGGELTIEGRKARAETPWIEPFRVDETYLIFGDGTEKGITAGDMSAFRLAGDHFSSRKIQGPKPNGIEETPAEAILADARRFGRTGR